LVCDLRIVRNHTFKFGVYEGVRSPPPPPPPTPLLDAQGNGKATPTSLRSVARDTRDGWAGTAFANQNSILEEIKSRLKSGNAFYHLVQNLVSSSLLSKNLKIKIYRTVILPVVLYGCETWSLTLREERRLKVSENMVLRIFGPKRDEVTREWRKLHNE